MKIKKAILYLVTAALLACFSLAAVPAAAEEPARKISTQIEIPATELEYYALNSPTDVYYDDEVTAILEANTRLILYKDGRYKEYSDMFGNISQVKRLGDYVIMQDRLSLYAFSLNYETDGIYEQLKDTDGEPIIGRCFAANGNYLATLSTTEIIVYKYVINGGKPEFTKYGEPIETSNNAANVIALNNNNDVFFIGSECLSRRNIDKNDGEKYTNINHVAAISADDNYIFVAYKSNEDSETITICKINRTTKATEKSFNTVTGSEDLSALANPVDFAFRNKNLLVCDNTLNKIIELDSETFEFTGFAITTTANAKNRLTSSTPDISALGGKTAVLNGDAMTVRSGSEYANYEVYDLKALGYTPSTVSLGDRFAAVSNNAYSRLNFVNLETGEIIPADNDLAPIDVSYANGYFYLLTPRHVYKVPESYIAEHDAVKANDFEYILFLSAYSSSDKIAADPDGNVFVYQNGGSFRILKYAKSGETFLAPQEILLENQSLKIAADLNGNVFSLASNNVLEYYKNGVHGKLELSLSENLPEGAAATSFALSYDDERVYFLFDGKGLMLSTAEAGNDSITNIAVPEDFVLTDVCAKPAGELKAVTVNGGANVYEVSFACRGDRFDFEKIAAADGDEYIEAGTSQGFKILVGKKMMLVKERDVAENIKTVSAPDINSGFTSTSVHLYYIPVLMRDESYKLTGVKRLQKDAPIEISGKITVNGKNFYYVKSGEVFGYVPCDTVTETLAGNFERDEVTYSTGKGKNAVRNALIVIIVAMSVTATSIYFINRKKIK